MNDRKLERDGFFEGLFTDLKPLFYWKHPSKRAWREYLAQQPSGNAEMDLEELLRWNDDQLQLRHHLLTCGRCASEVGALRRRTQLGAERWRPVWRVPRLVGYGAMAALVIAVGVWISISHGGPTSGCPPAGCRPPIYGDFGGGGVGS